MAAVIKNHADIPLEHSDEFIHWVKPWHGDLITYAVSPFIAELLGHLKQFEHLKHSFQTSNDWCCFIENMERPHSHLLFSEDMSIAMCDTLRALPHSIAVSRAIRKRTAEVANGWESYISQRILLQERNGELTSQDSAPEPHTPGKFNSVQFPRESQFVVPGEFQCMVPGGSQFMVPEQSKSWKIPVCSL